MPEAEPFFAFYLQVRAPITRPIAFFLCTLRGHFHQKTVRRHMRRLARVVAAELLQMAQHCCLVLLHRARLGRTERSLRQKFTIHFCIV